MPCYWPFKKEGEDIPLPCGKCPYCLQRRANDWIFRCIQEMNVSDTYHFVTLTYAQPPITPSGFMTLEVSAFQKFIKRLRHYERKSYPERYVRTEQGKKLFKSRIKYYGVGEYGSRYQRPHYHAIIFNSNQEDISRSWQGQSNDDNGVLVEFGRLEADILDGTDAIAYVAKYINKQKKIGKYEWDDRLPEFQLFSQGLGDSYLTDQTIRYHKNSKSLAVTVNGFKKALPRRYIDKIFTPHEKLLFMLHAVQKASRKLFDQEIEFEKSSFQGTFEEWRYQKKRQSVTAFLQISSQRKDV